MLTRRSFLLGTVPLSVGAVVASDLPLVRAVGPARTFTFGYEQPHETAQGVLADMFDKKLQELSGGTLRIKQFPSAALGQEPEMARKVRTGDIDFAINSTANTATVVPQSGVFSLHFLFRDEAHLERTVTDPGINEAFKKMIADNVTGARSLGLITAGFRNMYAKFPVKSAADLTGKKVRVQATKTEDAFFSAYHAIPVRMPFAQVYASLKTGLVQIAENDNGVYLNSKHYQVAPVLSRTEHEVNNNHLWVSQKTVDSLAEVQRTWVQAAADYARPIATRKALEFGAVAVKSLQKLGVKYQEQVDKQSLRALATPVQDAQAHGLGKYALQTLAMVRDLG